MNDEKARELYVRLTALKKHQEQLEGHIEELDQKTVEIRQMITAVSEVEHITAGEELLVPLANGIFLPATATSVGTLVLHVGADSAVKKTPQETTAILEKQQEELATFRQKLLAQYQELLAEVARTEEEARKEVGDV